MSRLDDDMKSRTLLVAFVFPDDFDDDVEFDADMADMVADGLCLIINEERQRNADDAGRPDYYQPLEISAIPSPQWVTSESLTRLRNNAADVARLTAENAAAVSIVRKLVAADIVQAGTAQLVALCKPGIVALTESERAVLAAAAGVVVSAPGKEAT